MASIHARLLAALAALSMSACAQTAPAQPRVRPDREQAATEASITEGEQAPFAKVYEMILSPAHAGKVVSQKAGIFITPLSLGRVDGRVVAINDYKASYNADYPPKRFAPDWFPVTIHGRFYDYRFTYYQCDMVGSRSERAPPYCPFDVSVRGEIVSLHPPTIKEVVTVKASWSSRPNPAGCPTGVGEWVWELAPK